MLRTVLDKSRREATIGFVADTAAGVESGMTVFDYDHGITSMIMELPNEENGCRFF
jgi:hypothetical protein